MWKNLKVISRYKLTKGGFTIITIEVSAKNRKTLSVEKEDVQNVVFVFITLYPAKMKGQY